MFVKKNVGILLVSVYVMVLLRGGFEWVGLVMIVEKCGRIRVVGVRGVLKYEVVLNEEWDVWLEVWYRSL